MQYWRKALVSPTDSILETIKVLDEARYQIAMVVNQDTKLLGIVTDGNIRRGILNGVDLSAPINTIMDRSPFTSGPGFHRLQLFETMMRHEYRRVPVLNDEGQVIDLLGIEELSEPEPIENMAVIMVGGLGTRLRPLTSSTPKPMVPVGNRPVLETIMMQLKLHGIRRIHLAVNHKAHVIEDYFGDGSDLGLDLHYIREEKRLGTAGALSLLPDKPSAPFVVMNGDLLTKLDFRALLDFHTEKDAAATMCLGEHWYEVPYGVAEAQDDRLVYLVEKPMQRFLVNAGIYVLSPEAVDRIPYNEAYDMPTLVHEMMEEKQSVATYLIRDYWIDIGRMDDLRQAQEAYAG